MFNFLQNLTQSAAEKRQAALNAYLDGALSARQRQEFERRLAEDADLRRDLDVMRNLRQAMRAMPQRSVPRSFTLDPARYGAPRKEPLAQAYPVLRAATALTAFFFIIALAAGLFTFGGLAPAANMTAQTALEAPAMEPMADEALPMATEGAGVAAEAAMESAIPSLAVTEDVIEERVEADEVFAEQAAEAEPEAADLTLEAFPAPASTAVPPAQDALSPLPTATQSNLPRPTEAFTAVPERAATAPAGAKTEEAASFAVMVEEGETAVAPPPTRPATTLTIWQWLQIGLGGLLVVLALVTWVARRRVR
jgi:hypothetical protein